MADALVINRGHINLSDGNQEYQDYQSYAFIKDYEILNSPEAKRVDEGVYEDLLQYLDKKIGAADARLSLVGFSIISVGDVSGNIFDSINLWGGVPDNFDVLYSGSLVYGSHGWQDTPQPDGWAIECTRENKIKAKECEWRNEVISGKLSLKGYKDSFVPEKFLSEDMVTIPKSEYVQLQNNQKRGRYA